MELSFAIETIKKEKEMNLYGNECFICDTKAMDTVLEALNNSVSKEYHEMVVKEQNDIINDLKSKSDNSISEDEIRKLIEEVDKQGDTSHVRQMVYYFADRTFVYKEGAIKILQELLGE